MKRSLVQGVRRLAAVAAGVIVALGVVAAVGAPAQASPPGCQYGAGHYEQAGGYITAYRYWFCDDGNDIPLNVNIQRYLSPGVWQTVASGSGDTTYSCNGSAYNVYRTNGDEFAILCG